MRIKFKGALNNVVILEVAYATYSDNIVYKNQYGNEISGSGLYVEDVRGSAWVIPGMTNATADGITSMLLVEGFYDLYSTVHGIVGYPYCC